MTALALSVLLSATILFNGLLMVARAIDRASQRHVEEMQRIAPIIVSYTTDYTKPATESVTDWT
jgi:hypothetical protein